MPPQYLARIEASRPALIARARDEYGLEINPGPFGINSRPALIGEKYAEQHGLGKAFHDAVIEAYWSQGQNLEDKSLLADMAEAVGLERDAFLAGLETPEYEETMLQDVAQAHAYGLTAVPALVFDDKYLVVGAQPYAVLKRVIQQCEQERANADT